jgi:hypothetical protein
LILNYIFLLLNKKSIMKRALLIITLLGFTATVLACTIEPIDFCTASRHYSNRSIISGKIISYESKHLLVEVIDVIKGIESKKTITIWDGEDYVWCQSTGEVKSMKSTQIGSIGDSVLLLLEKIDSVKNSWEQIGDYRTPDNYDVVGILQIENDTIQGGFDKGKNGFADFSGKVEYNYFKEYFATWNGCENITKTSIKEHKNTQDFFRYDATNKQLIIPNASEFDVLEVYTLDGRKVLSKTGNIDAQIGLSQLPKQVYILNTRRRNSNQSMTGKLCVF